MLSDGDHHEDEDGTVWKQHLHYDKSDDHNHHDDYDGDDDDGS